MPYVPRTVAPQVLAGGAEKLAAWNTVRRAALTATLATTTVATTLTAATLTTAAITATVAGLGLGLGLGLEKLTAWNTVRRVHDIGGAGICHRRREALPALQRPLTHTHTLVVSAVARAHGSHTLDTLTTPAGA